MNFVRLSIGLIAENAEIAPKSVEISANDRMELIIFNTFGVFNPDFVVLCGDTEIWSAKQPFSDISLFDGLELMVYEKTCEKYRILMELRKAYKNATDKTAAFFVKTPMIHVDLAINGRKMTALVDTGAQLSVITRDAAEKCGILGMLDERFKVDAEGIGGVRKALGKILNAELEFSGCSIPVVLTVFDSAPSELIVGVDVLTAYDANIDFRNKTLSFQNEVEVKWNTHQ